MSNDRKMNRRDWLATIAKATAAAAIGNGMLTACVDNHSARQTTVGTTALKSADLFARINCINCRHCMPCDFGVDIPAVFTFYNRAIEEKFLPDVTKPVDRAHAGRFLFNYNNAIDDKAQAHRCITCYHCAGHCPQNIFIARKMQLITDVTETLRNRICQDD